MSIKGYAFLTVLSLRLSGRVRYLEVMMELGLFCVSSFSYPKVSSGLCDELSCPNSFLCRYHIDLIIQRLALHLPRGVLAEHTPGLVGGFMRVLFPLYARGRYAGASISPPLEASTL